MDSLPQSTDPPPASLVENFFRHESASLLAVLTRTFGVQRMQLIEDCIQTALLKAMRSWRHGSVPQNPAGWVHRVAKNRILDALRRDATHKKALAFAHMDRESTACVVDDCLDEARIDDSLLRMIFVCCHPTIDSGSQVALTLKTLCGFGLREIASGLMLPVETVKKRIQRARRRLAAAGVSTDLPSDSELRSRVDAVHAVLYLMFNEGYSASGGDVAVRDDICEEATRLCHLLSTSPYAAAESKALLALLAFHAARLATRTDSTGGSILLEDQDRSQWDQRLISSGKYWLHESRTSRPSRFHFEAAIAQEHCIASGFCATNWQRIIQYYDRLLELVDSPVYRLNRAIAIGQEGHPTAALDQLRLLQNSRALDNYFLLNCALARVNELCGNHAEAIECYRTALDFDLADHQRRLINMRLELLLAARVDSSESAT